MPHPQQGECKHVCDTQLKIRFNRNVYDTSTVRPVLSEHEIIKANVLENTAVLQGDSNPFTFFSYLPSATVITMKLSDSCHKNLFKIHWFCKK